MDLSTGILIVSILLFIVLLGKGGLCYGLLTILSIGGVIVGLSMKYNTPLTPLIPEDMKM